MIFTVLDGKPVTFNNCRSIVGAEPQGCASNTCDNTGRDIELVEIAELIDYVRPETAYKDNDAVSYADKGFIEQHLSWTLTDFTKRTGILSREVKIKSQVGVRDYYITPPNGETIYRVKKVCVNGRCLQAFNNSTHIDCNNLRDGFVYEPMDKIVLDKALCLEACNITVSYETFVSNTACVVDKMIIERHQEAIVKGAAGKIRGMFGYGFTQLQHAQMLNAEYQRAIKQAKIDIMQGFANGAVLNNGFATHHGSIV